MTPTGRAVRLAIRPAAERDTPAIQRVAREAWEQTYRILLGAEARRELVGHLYERRSLAEDIARHESLFLVATVEEGVVGFAELVVEGRTGEVARVAVQPPWQGRGVGTALLRRGLDGLARKGVETVTAAVEVEDEAGRRLVERMGFRPTGEPATGLEGGGVELAQYRFRLKPAPEPPEEAPAEITVRGGASLRVCPRCGRRFHELLKTCPECGVSVVAEPRPEPEQGAGARFVSVVSTTDASRLAFAESALESAGIAYVREEVDSGKGPVTEVQVPSVRAADAREVLDALEEEGPAGTEE